MERRTSFSRRIGATACATARHSRPPGAGHRARFTGGSNLSSSPNPVGREQTEQMLSLLTVHLRHRCHPCRQPSSAAGSKRDRTHESGHGASVLLPRIPCESSEPQRRRRARSQRFATRKTGKTRPALALALAIGVARHVQGYSCGTTFRPALDGQAVNRALRSRGVKFRVTEFVSKPVSLSLVQRLLSEVGFGPSTASVEHVNGPTLPIISRSYVDTEFHGSLNSPVVNFADSNESLR